MRYAADGQRGERHNGSIASFRGQAPLTAPPDPGRMLTDLN